MFDQQIEKRCSKCVAYEETLPCSGIEDDGDTWCFLDRDMDKPCFMNFVPSKIVHALINAHVRRATKRWYKNHPEEAAHE